MPSPNDDAVEHKCKPGIKKKKYVAFFTAASIVLAFSSA